MSVELAWLISKYGDEAPMKGVEFSYTGRQQMKGVLNNRPYPIVAIDVERSAARRKVRDRERELLSGKPLKAMQIHDFLESFIEDESIARLWLRKNAADNSVPQFPSDYLRFRETWESISIELVKRTVSEQQSANEDNQAGDADELNDAVVAAGKAMVSRAQSDSE